MCLVSYIPTESGFIISSTRDETPLRADTHIESQQLNGKQVICPIDQKGGSWIYLSENGIAICVLNGAFIKHKRQLPYRMSRGLMMKHYFDFPDTKSFLKDFDFRNIEAFTMVIRDQYALYEFRWDELNKHILILDSNKSHLWSSSTLYEKEIQNIREKLFFDLLDKKGISLNSIKEIHQTGDIGDPENNFVMNRQDRVASISHTNAIVSTEGNHMHHLNLLNGKGETGNFLTASSGV